MTANNIFAALESAGRAILGSDAKALENGKLFAARLGDRVPEAKREIRIVAQALTDGISTQLKMQSAERNLVKDRIVKRLEDQHGYRQELARQAVDLIDRLVNGETAVVAEPAVVNLTRNLEAKAAEVSGAAAQAAIQSASAAPPQVAATAPKVGKGMVMLALLIAGSTLIFPAPMMTAFAYSYSGKTYFDQNMSEVLVLSFWLATPFGLLIAANGFSGAKLAAYFLLASAVARLSILLIAKEAEAVDLGLLAGIIAGAGIALVVVKVIEARGAYLGAASAGGILALAALLLCTLGMQERLSSLMDSYVLNPWAFPAVIAGGAIGGLVSAATGKLFQRLSSRFSR